MNHGQGIASKSIVMEYRRSGRGPQQKPRKFASHFLPEVADVNITSPCAVQKQLELNTRRGSSSCPATPLTSNQEGIVVGKAFERLIVEKRTHGTNLGTAEIAQQRSGRNLWWRHKSSSRPLPWRKEMIKISCHSFWNLILIIFEPNFIDNIKYFAVSA